MRFQLGNKFGRGRPKGSGFVLRCRDWADCNGWEKLEKWAAGKDAKLAFEATKLLLAYGYGKPLAEIDLSAALESLQGAQITQDPNDVIRMLLAIEGESLEKREVSFPAICSPVK